MEIQKGDIVSTPKAQHCTVLGVSSSGRATLRTAEGVVIAIDVKELKKVQPKIWS